MIALTFIGMWSLLLPQHDCMYVYENSKIGGTRSGNLGRSMVSFNDDVTKPGLNKTTYLPYKSLNTLMQICSFLYESLSTRLTGYFKNMIFSK